MSDTSLSECLQPVYDSASVSLVVCSRPKGLQTDERTQCGRLADEMKGRQIRQIRDVELRSGDARPITAGAHKLFFRKVFNLKGLTKHGRAN